MNKETLTSVKLKIKKVIKDKKISIYRLASEADISDTCIRNWYNKRNYTPSLYALEKVCNALDLSLSQLLIDEGETLYPINDELDKLIKYWNKLDSQKKDACMQLIQKLAE